MKTPESPLPPVPDIIRSAYATLVVTDLAEARRFWVDLLGFVVTDEDGSALYLRGYDELTHHNLILRAGPEAAAGALGFRVRAAADLAKAEAYYEALGCRTERMKAGTVRGVGEVVRVEDPLGFLIDFFARSDHPERLQQRYDLRRGAEVARLDHFNICVPDVPRAHEPHSVLRMCDILGSLSLESHIERGPGRHGVSNAFYVYLRDPDGHRLEIYTSDYYTGDPDHPVLRWSVLDPRRRDFWGNAVIPSWYSDASPVLDLDGKVRPVVELAQTAEVTVGADGFTAPLR